MTFYTLVILAATEDGTMAWYFLVRLCGLVPYIIAIWMTCLPYVGLQWKDALAILTAVLQSTQRLPNDAATMWFMVVASNVMSQNVVQLHHGYALDVVAPLNAIQVRAYLPLTLTV